jgi:hypothetical protein
MPISGTTHRFPAAQVAIRYSSWRFPVGEPARGFSVTGLVGGAPDPAKHDACRAASPGSNPRRTSVLPLS